jgi:hypothetical protein
MHPPYAFAGDAVDPCRLQHHLYPLIGLLMPWPRS